MKKILIGIGIVIISIIIVFTLSYALRFVGAVIGVSLIIIATYAIFQFMKYK